MLIINIKKLFGLHLHSHFLKGKEMACLPALENAYLRIEGEQISDFGPMEELDLGQEQEVIDASGRLVLPAWCDSHTHLIFSGSREHEFIDKIKGLSYAEIAAKGGGIHHSAKHLRLVSEEALFQAASKRLQEIARTGTGAVEIKSGYGLTTESELKMLRVIKRLKQTSNLSIKSTFLGAHAIPEHFKENKQQYIQEIIEVMLPLIAKEKLADYIDVFCEKDFFDLQDTEQILRAGKSFGLKPKVHANQLSNFGAVQLGVKENAISVDHLENMTKDEIDCLGLSSTIPTLLPGAAFFLRLDFPPARTMIDSGLGIAIASDYNPGSSPSGNIPYLLALSCIQMRLLPEEAINAATLNGACAIGLEAELGSIAIGKKANLIITKQVPNLAYLPYAYSEAWVEQVVLSGKLLTNS